MLAISSALLHRDLGSAHQCCPRGHAVPIEKIVARRVRAIGNLDPAIALADRVYIYDNSVDAVEARLFTRTQNGLLRKIGGACRSGLRMQALRWSAIQTSSTRVRRDQCKRIR
jgi:hypothetical protein